MKRTVPPVVFALAVLVSTTACGEAPSGGATVSTGTDAGEPDPTEPDPHPAEPDAEPVDPSSEGLTLGTGERIFSPIADGDALPLVFGSQGGYHVWLGFRVEGFEGPRLDVEITTRLVDDPDSERRSALPLTLEPAEAGGLEFVGWPAVIDTDSCPVSALLELSVRITEGDYSVADSCIVEIDTADTLRLPASCAL